jgi:DNA-binding NtrC family response regulator
MYQQNVCRGGFGMNRVRPFKSSFNGADVKEPVSYREAKAFFEKEYLENLLKWANGNVQKAARRADRDRKGLYILMAKYGINPARHRNNKEIEDNIEE